MVKIWDPRMEKPLVASGEHEFPIETASFGQTNEQLIVAFGNSCALWDLRQMFAQGPIMTLQPHLKTILALGYDKIKDRIITCGADSMLKFIDPKVFSIIILLLNSQQNHYIQLKLIALL